MEIGPRVSKNEENEVIQRLEKNKPNRGQINLRENQIKVVKAYCLKSLKSHEEEVLRGIKAPSNLFNDMLRSNKDSNKKKWSNIPMWIVNFNKKLQLWKKNKERNLMGKIKKMQILLVGIFYIWAVEQHQLGCKVFEQLI